LYILIDEMLLSKLPEFNVNHLSLNEVPSQYHRKEKIDLDVI